MASSSRLCAKGSATLPLQLVEEEILHRTTIEDLIRFKSTCKEWYALFNSKRFMRKHLHVSQKWLIRICHDVVQIINPVTLNLLSLPLPVKFPLRDRNILIIHCDGLLLCRYAYGRKVRKHKLAVWNPVLSSGFKWIEPSHAYKPHYDALGFGYNNDNKYKILKFDATGGREYEIYDLESKLWTSFPATFDWSPILSSGHHNVSMKGNMYWIARNKKTCKSFIQSFDFSTETFKPICSSNPVEVWYRGVYHNDRMTHLELDTVALSDFGGDRLSLLHEHKVEDSTREIKMEVWVTNKVTDGVVSWSKYFEVTHSHLPISLHHDNCYLRNPSYFIHKTNGIMLWGDSVYQDGDTIVRTSFYEICEAEIKKQVEIKAPFRSDGLNNPCVWGSVYFPSLVPVPE